MRKPLVLLAGLLLIAGLVFAGEPQGQGRGDPHVFRVVDKNGRLVGFAVTDNLVSRQIGSDWVTFYVHPMHGIFDSGAIYVHYLTTDCSGPGFVPHYTTFSEGTRVGPKLYFPTDVRALSPQSLRVVTASAPGACYPASNIEGDYGVATTVDVDSFGFELPFKAVQ